MIDLADLDRRAALAMGWKLLTGGDGEAYGLPPTGGPWRGFDPTTDANDCREFEQWALAHGVTELVTVVEPEAALASAHATAHGGWESVRAAGAGLAEHGPSYDLVARVLALLDALETEGRNDDAY